MTWTSRDGVSHKWALNVSSWSLNVRGCERSEGLSCRDTASALVWTLRTPRGRGYNASINIHCAQNRTYETPWDTDSGEHVESGTVTCNFGDAGKNICPVVKYF